MKEFGFSRRNAQIYLKKFRELTSGIVSIQSKGERTP